MESSKRKMIHHIQGNNNKMTFSSGTMEPEDNRMTNSKYGEKKTTEYLP